MVRVKSISIERFRGIRQGEVDGLTDVNILIGRNNSGKSTVVETLMRVGYGREGADLLGRQIYHLWDQPRNAGNEFPELWYKQDQTQPISLVIRLGGDTDDGRLAEFGVTITGTKLSLNVEPTKKSPGGAISQQADPFTRAVQVFQPRDTGNRDIENNLWRLLINTRRDKLLAQAINDVFGLNAEGIQLLPDGKLVLLFAEHGLPLDLQGDGTRAALRCMMMLSAVKSTMFIIEEPECHQHPGSLERFAGTLCKQAKSQDVQLFLSTHSAECVRAFLKGASEAGTDCAVFHLHLEDGFLDARRLDVESVETLQNTGVDVRFLDLYA